MRLNHASSVAAVVALIATPALASTVVAPAGREPLTLLAIFSHAAAPVKLIALLLLAGMIIGPVAALTRADPRWLGAISRSALPLGLAAAAYTLLSGAVGIANLGATPSLAVLAPGIAEALMMAMLGLLTAGVARLTGELTARRANDIAPV